MLIFIGIVLILVGWIIFSYSTKTYDWDLQAFERVLAVAITILGFVLTIISLSTLI